MYPVNFLEQLMMIQRVQKCDCEEPAPNPSSCSAAEHLVQHSLLREGYLSRYNKTAEAQKI